MDKIQVEDISLYGYHGCLEEEGKIGTDYLVNLTVWADLRTPARSDVLTDTVDYVILNRIAAEEMAIRSKLIEHVAQRIIDRILREVPMVQKVKIKLSKRHPPINGNVAQVSTIMTRKR